MAFDKSTCDFAYLSSGFAGEIQREINTLRQFLASSDYKAIKHSEGVISDKDYAETKAQRQAWRDKINELQARLITPDAAP